MPAKKRYIFLPFRTHGHHLRLCTFPCLFYTAPAFPKCVCKLFSYVYCLIATHAQQHKTKVNETLLAKIQELKATGISAEHFIDADEDARQALVKYAKEEVPLSYLPQTQSLFFLKKKKRKKKKLTLL